MAYFDGEWLFHEKLGVRANFNAYDANRFLTNLFVKLQFDRSEQSINAICSEIVWKHVAKVINGLRIFLSNIIYKVVLSFS